MKKVAIFPNIERDTKLGATAFVAKGLIGCGKTVLLPEAYKNMLDLPAVFLKTDEIFCKAELIITLGGDGTLLRIAAEAATKNIPIMGINIGHLGFLTQAENGDSEIFEKLANGKFSIKPAMMLKATIKNKNGETVGQAAALNDFMMKSAESKMLSLDVKVNGTSTNRCHADGLIVASATGSTAYSLSCGGPIVHPELECMLITPICPHTLKSRCIVIPPEKVITVELDFAYSGKTVLKADGETVHIMADGDYIEIVKSEKAVKMVNLEGFSYFDVIRRKLSD